MQKVLTKQWTSAVSGNMFLVHICEKCRRCHTYLKEGVNASGCPYDDGDDVQVVVTGEVDKFPLPKGMILEGSSRFDASAPDVGTGIAQKW